MSLFHFNKLSGRKNRQNKTGNRSFHFEALENREMLSATPYDTGESIVATYGTSSSESFWLAEATSDSVTLSWDAAKMDGVRPTDPFVVQKLTYVEGKNGQQEEKWVEVAKVAYNYSIGKGVYSCEIKDLVSSTDYTFRILYGSTASGEGTSDRLKVTTLPCELNAKAASSHSIGLTWNIAGKKGTNFIVQRWDGINWVDVDEIAADGSATKTKTSTITGLEAGTTYQFRLSYYDLDTAKQLSQTATCQTLFTLEASDPTTGTVDLSWAASMGGDNHVVQICDGGKSPSTETNWTLASTEWLSDARKFQVNGLKGDASYYFRVRYTVQVDGETQVRYTDVLNYASPGSIKVDSTTSGSAIISWEFSAYGNNRYYIETSLDGTNWTGLSQNNTGNKTFELKNLDPGTTYHVRVRYMATADREAYSTVETFTTRVETVLDGVTSDSATISWDIPNQGKNTTVDVQRCDHTLDPALDSNWQTIETNVSGNQYTNRYLASDREYFYRIAYFDSEGERQYTLAVTALTSGILKASDITMDSVHLSWNFVPVKTLTVQYATDRLPQNDAGWSNVITGWKRDADNSGGTVGGLKPNTTYYFRVVYTSEKGTEEQITTVAVVGTQVEHIVVSEKTDTSVTIDWAATGFDTYKANTRFVVQKYEISNRENEGNTWISVKTVETSVNSYTIEGLLANTEYQFRIIYEGGASGSDAVTVRTDAHSVNVENVTQTSAKLTWNFDTDKDTEISQSQNGNGEGNYVVQRYKGDGEPTEEEARTASPDVWENVGSPYERQQYYNLDGFKMNTVYYYRVVYTYRNGEPKESSSGTDWILSLTTQYSAVAAVRTLSDIKTAKTEVNKVSIAWDAKKLDADTKYTIQVSTNAQSWDKAREIVVENATATSYMIDDLAADTEYFFRVKYNGDQYTQITSGTTGTYDLSLTSKNVDLASARATFQMYCVPELETNFKLYYRVAGADSWPAGQYVDGTVSSSSGTVSFAVSDLVPEKEYEFKVVYDTTFDGSTKRHESDLVAIFLGDDLMPSDVAADRVTIQWDPASFYDKTASSQYIVEWRIAGSGSAWKSSSTLSASTTSYVVTGLQANTAYEFRVQYSSSGSSANSTLKTVTTAPPTITVSATQVDRVRLEWDFKSAGEYQIQYKNTSGQWVTVRTVGTGNLDSVLDNLGSDGAFAKEKEYTFRIAYKVTADGEWVYSDEALVTTLFGIRVTDNSLTSQGLTVQWDYRTDDVYEVLYRKAGTATKYEESGELAAGTGEYTITGLLAGTDYEIVLVYRDGSEQRETVVVRTLKLVPSSPDTFKVASRYSTSVKLTWNDNSADSEEEYVLEVTNTLTGTTEKIILGERIGTGSCEYLLTGLLSNSSYSAKLYVRNDEGASSELTVTFTTTDVTAMNAVKTLKAITTPKTITLTWAVTSIQDVPDPEKFRIEYYDTETKLWYEVETIDSKTWSVSNYFHYGSGDSRTKVVLEDQTSYKFRVFALGEIAGSTEIYGDSAKATEVNAKTASLVAPTKLAAKSLTMTTATISFTDTDTKLPPSEKTYEIGYIEGKYTKTNPPDYADMTWITVSYKDMSAVLTGLNPATTYTYVVRSTHEQGGAISALATFTTSKMVASTKGKGGFTVTENNKFAFLISWTPPASGSVPAELTASYQIEISLSGKSDSFISVPFDPVKVGSGGLAYTTVELYDLITALKQNNIDVSSLKSVSFRVTTHYSRGGETVGSAMSSVFKVTMPSLT